MSTLAYNRLHGRSIGPFGGPSGAIGKGWEEESPEQVFQQACAEYLQSYASFQEVAKRRFYENQNIQESDIRFHLMILGQLIAEGQELAIFYKKYFGESSPGEGMRQLFLLIEQTIHSLVGTLQEWHGLPGSHKDEPEAFGQALKEAQAGKLEEW